MANENRSARWHRWKAKEAMKGAIEDFNRLPPLALTGKVKGPPPQFDFDTVMIKFAEEFITKQFIEGVLYPAFWQGTGIPGRTSLEGNEYGYQPQIELGYSSIHGHTYQRHTGFDDRGRATGGFRFSEYDRVVADLREKDTAREAKFAALGRRPTPEEQQTYYDHGKRRLEAAEARDLKRQSRFGTQTLYEEKDVGEENNTGGGDWVSAFNDLWKRLTILGPTKMKGRTVVVQMGPMSQLMAMRLSAQTHFSQGPPNGSTERDSFFLAAERGTGIAANVGQGHERLTKKNSKDGIYQARLDDGTIPSEKFPGGWWWGTQTTGGGFFTGQRGLHFLYDERTRAAQPIYQQWIGQNIGPAFAQFMGKYQRR